jgi:hypothetical protein
MEILASYILAITGRNYQTGEIYENQIQTFLVV